MSAFRIRPSHIAIATLLAGVALGVAIDRTAFAQQPAAQAPTIKRTVLGKMDVPPGPVYEGVMAIAEIPVGGTSGRHRHPGVELAYVLEGSVSVKYEDGTTKTFKPGDAMQNHGIHNATNPGKVPVKILGVYIVEKGKPMAELVP